VLRLRSIGPTTMSDDARRVSAGGAAQAAVMRASSEDRKAAGAGSGSPPPAGYRIQLKSADMKEEMRQEAFDIARVVRAASRLYSIRIISRALRPAALLALTDGLVSVFFSPSGGFLFWVQAFEKHTMEKDIAEYIKKEFDRNHGPTWHCIVGRNFGNALVPLPGNTPVHGSRWVMIALRVVGL
jgi:dynein light chain LC8-type